MSLHISGEIDAEKILPMEEIEQYEGRVTKPVVQKMVKKTAKIPSQKRKRCAKGSRKNRKTKRCNKNCTPKQKRNPKTKRCVDKCLPGQKRHPKTRRCV